MEFQRCQFEIIPIFCDPIDSYLAICKYTKYQNQF